MRESFVAFGVGIGLAVTLSIGTLAFVGISKAPTGGVPGAAVADVFECASGDLVQSSFSKEASAFRVVGQLQAIDGGDFSVKAPNGDVELTLAFESTVAGRYDEGDLVQVGGRIDKDGQLEATDVRGGCPVGGSFVAQPTQTPRSVVQDVAPASTPTPAPSESASPADADDGDDDVGTDFVRVVAGDDVGVGFPPPAVTLAPSSPPQATPTQAAPKPTPTKTPAPPHPTPVPTVLPTTGPTLEPTPEATPGPPTPRPVGVVLPADDSDDLRGE